jgi:hypothetical protein
VGAFPLDYFLRRNKVLSGRARTAALWHAPHSVLNIKKTKCETPF